MSTETKQPEREKFTMDKDLAGDLCQGASTTEFKFIEDTMVDHKRWSVVHRIIIQRLSDGKFFKTPYYVPATEAQEQEPFGYDEPTWTEVFPITRNVTLYE